MGFGSFIQMILANYQISRVLVFSADNQMQASPLSSFVFQEQALDDQMLKLLKKIRYQMKYCR
jgi:hypothetical protein